MGTDSDGCAPLTAKHGCKCLPDESITVEDCLIAIGSEVGSRNIVSASRMNKAVVVFLREVSLVQHLVEFGLSIRDTFLPVLPLSSPSKKVILSNVPPFITDDSLERLLGRYGKIVGPIKMIPLGLKNPEFKHVMSFRRQTFMILNAEFQSLNTSAKTTLLGKEYTIYISTESMRCFTCGKYGHTKLVCKMNDGVNASTNVTELNPSEEQLPSVSLNNEGRKINGEGTDQKAEAPSLPKDGQSTNEPVPNKHSDDVEHTPVITVESVNDNTVRDEVERADVDPGEISEVDRAIESAELVRVGGESMDSQVSELSQAQDDTGMLIEGSEVQSMDSDSDTSDIAESQGGSAEIFHNLRHKHSHYTVRQINEFLDVTFNQRKPKLEKYFPDLQLFLESCTLVMKKTTLEELDQPKRYRLKKYMSTVKKKVKSSS